MKLSLWLGALFVISLTLFTRENRFPFFYHPDEPGKVRQVIEADWNFHHPMLMLNASRIAAIGAEKTEQNIVVIGRWISAIFTSVAVVALSLLAFHWRGMFGAISTGALLLLHHQLFELAHYMKEDTALLMGLALVFLTMAWLWKKPSVAAATFAGVACGLAISGKYLGVVSLALVVPVLLRTKRRGLNLTIFAAAILVTFAAVNWPMLSEFGRSRESLNREMNLVVGGQGGMTRRVPHAQYWNVFIDNTTPVIWLLLIIYAVRFWKTRAERSLPEWLMTIFPVAFALMLSFSPKTNDRYFLPATAMFTVLAALGIRDAAALFPRNRHIIQYALLALALAAQLPSMVKYFRAFQVDDRREMQAWMEANIPANAVVIEDTRVRLSESSDRITAKKIAKLADMDELTTLGAEYAVVSESDYGKYFLRSQKPQGKYAADFQRRKTLYEELFRRGTLRWERARGTVIYLHPGLKVYELPVNSF